MGGPRTRQLAVFYPQAEETFLQTRQAASNLLPKCKTSPLLMLSKVNGQDLSTDHAFALARRLVEGEADT
jgi:hypothetical protein